MIVYRVKQPTPGLDKLPYRTEFTADAEGFSVALYYKLDSVSGPSLYRYFSHAGAWDSLRSPAHEASDHAFYARVFAWDKPGVASLRDGIGALSNLFLHTKATRASPADFLAQQRLGIVHGFVVPFMDAAWSEVVFAANIPEGSEFLTNGLEMREAATFSDVIGLHMPVMLPLGATNVSGNLWEVSFEVLDGRSGSRVSNQPAIFFEATAGRLLTQRATLSEGVAKALLDCTDLPLGSAPRVKAGFKHYPGMADCTVPV